MSFQILADSDQNITAPVSYRIVGPDEHGVLTVVGHNDVTYDRAYDIIYEVFNTHDHEGGPTHGFIFAAPPNSDAGVFALTLTVRRVDLDNPIPIGEEREVDDDLPPGLLAMFVWFPTEVPDGAK